LAVESFVLPLVPDCSEGYADLIRYSQTRRK
jgi:hypothetical protein